MTKISASCQWEKLLNNHHFGRRYRMTFVIGLESMLFAFIMMLIPQINHWAVIFILSAGICLSVFNLIILKLYHCVRFSSHFLISLIFLTIIFVNYVAGGINTSLFIWFYIVPIISSALAGMTGLIVYGSMSIMAVLAYLFLPHAPLFQPPDSLIWYVHLLNFVFAMVLVLTVLFTFLIEINNFEKQNLMQQKILEAEREKLLHLSRHDVLSKLPNRKYFYEEFRKRIRSGDKLTILYMDLNGFKNINDKYGHEVGDKVLVETSKRLNKSFRSEDFIARVGGDEFIGIISCENIKIVNKIITRIRKVFSHQYRNTEHQIKLDIAIGIAQFPEDGQQIEKLVALADQRMYDEKTKMKLV